jgi:outer membrane protein OmpA-like peptidoglycan-associated protein
MSSPISTLITLTLAALLTGCATEGYVDQKTTAMGLAVNARADSEFLKLEPRLRSLDSQASALDGRIGKVESSLGTTHRLAQEALDRANASHLLAQGKLAYEVTLTDDQIRFAAGSAALNKPAEEVLAALVKKIKADNRNFYIEIQGHTDQVGDKAENKLLGLARAESVRDFLHTAGLPLHRMNVISYGSSQPLVKGNASKARAQNRRVVLMVLV